MNYALFCYKENTVDTCRGCVMDRYDSDFQHLTTRDENELVEFWANLLWNESGWHTDHSTSHEIEIHFYNTSYDIHFLVNGEDQYAYDADDDTILQVFDRVPAAVKQRLESLSKAKQAAEEAKKIKLEQQAADDLAKKQKAAEARERAEFKRLAEKYGSLL